MPKILRRVLSERGSATTLPKDIVREARAAGIVEVDDAVTLLDIIDDRNRMVHDYSEEYALELLERVRARFSKSLSDLARLLRM